MNLESIETIINILLAVFCIGGLVVFLFMISWLGTKLHMNAAQKQEERTIRLWEKYKKDNLANKE